MNSSGNHLLSGFTINRSQLSMVIMMAAILGTGCKSLDQSVDVPSYINIPSIALQTNYTLEGTDDHHITDAWVLLDDNSLGAYELPATIPVLADGDHVISLFAGIEINGIASSRTIYPFFNDTAMPVTLIPGSTLTLSPKIFYYPDITFAWLEDFEIGSTLITGSSSDTSLSLKQVEPLPALGAQSAVVHLDAAHDYFFASTLGKNFVLVAGQPVYMEFHYASNIEFSVGAVKKTLSGSSVTMPPYFNLYPSSSWNKIYINLTDYLRTETDALSFEIYFACQYDAAVSDNTLCLDNIKLIHK